MSKAENLKDLVVHAFKNVGMTPREHQWRAISKLILDLLTAKNPKGKVKNYLLQQAAGSGKTMTIACLALMLTKLDKRTCGYDTIVILNDRTQLDDQMANTVTNFLIKNKLEPSLVRQITDSSSLKATLCGRRCKVIVTTIQKFIPLFEKEKDVPDNLRLALIADEAHRTHGSKFTVGLHELLCGQQRQSSGTTYFSFTCTPIQQTLQNYGTPTPDGRFLPFSTYSFERAVEDRVVMDVTDNIIHYRKDKWNDISKDISPETITSKAKWILKDFIKRSAELSNKDFQAKGMLVVSGRPHIIEYKKQMELLLPGLSKKAGVKPFDIVYTFTNFTYKGQEWTESMQKVSGNVVQQFIDPNSNVKFIIVAEKLQTGFDAPPLSILYIDKQMNREATIVQTLGRLSRTAKGKKQVCVIDFYHTRETIKKAFKTFDDLEEPDKHTFKSEERDLLTAHKANPTVQNYINNFYGALKKSQLSVSERIKLMEKAREPDNDDSMLTPRYPPKKSEDEDWDLDNCDDINMADELRNNHHRSKVDSVIAYDLDSSESWDMPDDTDLPHSNSGGNLSGFLRTSSGLNIAPKILPVKQEDDYSIESDISFADALRSIPPRSTTAGLEEDDSSEKKEVSFDLDDDDYEYGKPKRVVRHHVPNKKPMVPRIPAIKRPALSSSPSGSGKPSTQIKRIKTSGSTDGNGNK